MKKLSLLPFAFALILLLQACSGSKEARNNKKTIDGNWTLQNITFEGITGRLKAQVLDEAGFECFENSAWRFNQNTSLGSYEITKNGGECASKKQNFRWSIYEEKGMPTQLQFKKVDAKFYKPIDEKTSGYRLKITSISKTNMQVKSEIMFEGKPAFLVYNFVKG